jgi:hypothetical protein
VIPDQVAGTALRTGSIQCSMITPAPLVSRLGFALNHALVVSRRHNKPTLVRFTFREIDHKTGGRCLLCSPAARSGARLGSPCHVDQGSSHSSADPRCDGSADNRCRRPTTGRVSQSGDRIGRWSADSRSTKRIGGSNTLRSSIRAANYRAPRPACADS